MNVARPSKFRLTPASLAVLAALAVMGVFLFVPPIVQDPGFHRFADRRTLLGIPNALDVLSNLPFIVVGVLGFVAARDPARAFVDPWERLPWTVLFAAVVATAFGSAFYHLTPTNATLFWDRLPQTLITLGLVTAMLAERTTVTVGRRLLWPLLATGVIAAVVWRATGDLRLYGLVQFLPALLVPLLLILNPPRYTRSALLWVALGWYVVARLCEFLDYEIYGDVGISGHTLKHLAAAASVWWLARHLRARQPVAAEVSR